MVFEESTFVLTKGPAKAAAELPEPAVSDPSMKLDIPEQPGPALDCKSPDAGEPEAYVRGPVDTPNL